MAATNPAADRGGFSLGALRLPIAALGIFLVLVGLMAWLVLGSFDAGVFTVGTFPIGPRLFLAAGILLVGVVVALEPGDVWSAISGRSGLVAGNTLVIALAALGILGLANVLGSRYTQKVDLTANQSFTLSDQSVQVAKSLPQPVHVTGFFTGSSGLRADFERLLQDYASASNGRLTYDFVDPEQRPGEAIAAGIREINSVVFQMGDKKQNSTGTQERDITTALIKLTRPEKNFYFTTGHGERTIDGFNPADYGQLKQAMERDNFKVQSLNLISTRTVPSDADAVVMAGPTNPLLPDEMDALRAYLDGGGKLIVLADPQSKTDLNPLLQRYEVSFSGNYVVDPAQAFFGDELVPVVTAYKSHPVTQDLRLATFFPAANAIKFSPDNPSVTAIAESSDRSWAETNLQEVQGGRPTQQPDQEQAGPQSLFVTVEQAVPGGAEGAGRSTRIVLIGTPNFVANNALSLDVPAGNLDLFMNAANWLADQVDISGIRPKPTDTRQLLLQGTQLNLIVWSSALFLPLAVLAVGVAVWWTRR